jgi:hypothetical protein
LKILDIIRGTKNGGALDGVARAYGVDPRRLDAVIDVVVPALAQRLEANTLSRGGIADLLVEAGRPEHLALMRDPAKAAREPWAATAGIGALATVLGDKAHSRAVAARAAAASGLDQGLVQKLLPIIASLVMAAIAKGSKGALSDIVKRVPGANPPPPPRPAPAEVRRVREPETVGGPSGRESGRSPLPLPGDPPLSDAPLPVPGPYGNLPDIVRRGDTRVDGDPLARTIRDVLGPLLGFQSKGVLGWIVRFLVVRYGWNVLMAVVRRVLGR